MKKIKVQLVKYDLIKTKNRKRKEMLVDYRSEEAVITQLERIHKGESVTKIHEIIWGESQSSESSGDLYLGTVKFFELDKGFGFIQPDEDMEDLFFHASACANGVPGDGDRVEFEISRGPKGLAAIRVKLSF